MNPWRSLLADMQSELERASQQVGSYRVLPDRIRVLLPRDRFRRWEPVLDRVAEEIGRALMNWAGSRETLWYRALGPQLDLRLSERAAVSVECDFSRPRPRRSAAPSRPVRRRPRRTA